MSQISNIKLNDGLLVPQIGFGTYGLNGEEGVKCIENAINVGYRLIDTAFNYENEGAVGQAIKKSHVSRDELIICSKLPGRHHAYKKAIVTIEESLYRAGLDYFDIYLIHWPNPKVGLYIEAWEAMIEAKKKGYLKSIGVCNFLPEHITALIKETSVTPSLNQIELHPYYNQEDQRNRDSNHGIITESWSPLGRARDIMDCEVLTEIAKDYQKTVSQIILRWHIQLGAIPIPKASTIEHQKQNLDVFDFQLSNEAIRKINQLTKVNGRLQNQDPKEYEEF